MHILKSLSTKCSKIIVLTYIHGIIEQSEFKIHINRSEKDVGLTKKKKMQARSMVPRTLDIT